jgi:hypothetical protein
VNLLADPERQIAQFIGSSSKPQGAKLFSSCFTLLSASRAIHASGLGMIAGGVFFAHLVACPVPPLGILLRLLSPISLVE